ncbi:MAG: hypothetical protein LKI22_03435 [Liquorilactobacillus nagelii]|uniref:hypothetical protein n=1 Tax=Liquorilactobacillus nagelii TaxID=82688 RepID=UPI00242D60F2|nr:hypothetical protein [Liquorilactobacillus nagelii]MCI1632991.1 hypothetical protein [Liquorilactobacillus nagelii]
MLFIKSKEDSDAATELDIKLFVSKMSYWQNVHLLMSAYYLDNPGCSKEDAYEYALDNSTSDDAIIYAMGKIINLGSILR